jgi:hypothetical protein
VIDCRFSETSDDSLLLLLSWCSVHSLFFFIGFSMLWRRMEMLTSFRGHPMAELCIFTTPRPFRTSLSPITCLPCLNTSLFSSNWDCMALPDLSGPLYEKPVLLMVLLVLSVDTMACTSTLILFVTIWSRAIGSSAPRLCDPAPGS